MARPWLRSPASWLSGLLILALWLSLRPFPGIVHDARFYALQALQLLDGEAFRGDLYFAHGVPETFSPITSLYAWAIARVGLARANLVLTVLCQALWLAGLACLARTLVAPARLAVLSMTSAIALPSGYGALQLFHYAEPFLTPRLPAEGLSMIGLALMLSGRPILSWPILLAATLVHPLIGWPALAVAVLWLVSADRRWLILPAAAAAAGLLLALLGVQPLPRLLQAFDAQWFQLVRARSPYTLIQGWTILDVARVLSEVGLALAALTVADRRLRRFLAACLAVGIAGLLLSAAAGDLGRDILLVQLQPWRSLWVLTLAANMAAGPLLGRALGEHADGAFRVAAIGGVTSLVASRVSQGFLLLPPFLFLLGLPLFLWQGAPPSRRVRRLRLALAVALALLSLALAGKIIGLMQRSAAPVSGLAQMLVAAVVLGCAAALARKRPERSSWLLGLLALALLVPVAATWDRRSGFDRFVTSEPGDASLAELLPVGARVYWEGGTELLWFKLRRPSYFSCIQGTQGLFFRDVAVEYDRRAASFAPLHTADFEHLPGDTCPSGPASMAPAVTIRSVAELCRREPDLDYLVLTSPLERGGFARWRSPAMVEVDRVTADDPPRLHRQLVEDFYFYRCADLRG